MNAPYIIIQELVIDVAVVTSSRYADRSCIKEFWIIATLSRAPCLYTRCFAVAKPRFSGRRSFSMVLSQVV